jgi:hypothetical protein
MESFSLPVTVTVKREAALLFLSRRLHQHDAYEICFAKRGQSDRTAAFQSALEAARQRFYERGEDRYLEYLWPSFRLVRDLDDTKHYRYGEYYTQKKPLTLAARKKLPGI